MPTDNTADLGAVTDKDQRNFLRCALRILIAPSLSALEVERLIKLLVPADRPQPLRSQLGDYLWEHHMEELVVSGRDDLDTAIVRIALAFEMLDESERCAPTPPLLWLDLSQPLTSNDRRLR